MKKLIVFGTCFVMILLLPLLLYTTMPITPAGAQEGVEIPFLDLWAGSGHADASAEAFVHWDEDDPAEVPDRCAKCHSTPGHMDFLGVDGTAAGVVDSAAEIGTTVECVACHNEANLNKDSVVMPSGLEISGLGREARCMECHQGRNSKIGVDEALAEAGVTVDEPADDEINEELGFQNIHYYAAAATKYGTMAKGGYEYDGKSYDANFAHVDDFNTCIDCHDSHTLAVRVEACSDCHTDVTVVEDLQQVRMPGSMVDYDGDDNVEEGIYFELEGMQTLLYEAIQAYAADVVETPIVYDSHSYPYFFIDTNADGETDEEEVAFPNRYATWTPRLLKAAYNYQTSLKDPGAFAHGGKYIIQLLYDSLEDLNSTLPKPIDMDKLNRIDDGHFAGSEEAFRHWDEDGEVPARCSKCHSSAGAPLYLKDNATISQPVSNGLQCETCHASLSEDDEFARHEVTEVEFPSGAVVASDPNTNLCMTCHQGRSSKVTVDEAIADLKPDVVADELGFLNIHYFAAGATRFGTEVQGAYEYEGQEYKGFYDHAPDYSSCTDCHSPHGLDVKVQECAECHDGVETKADLATIREYDTDFDGDGDTDEGVAEEIDTMRALLYAAIQDYAATEVGTELIYDSHSYPYFFVDSNANGDSDPGEAIFPNKYATWTPRLLKAAYNYQYSSKDLGAFTHNPDYILQILYDSLRDIGAATDDLSRP